MRLLFGLGIRCLSPLSEGFTDSDYPFGIFKLFLGNASCEILFKDKVSHPRQYPPL
jgi:hypothetical protein